MGDPRDDAGPRGPSWYDVNRLVGEIQTRHDVAVVIEFVPHTEKGRGVTSFVVFAGAKPPKQLDRPYIQRRSAWFRGNRGASTITAALWWSLSELNEALTEYGGQARLPGGF